MSVILLTAIAVGLSLLVTAIAAGIVGGLTARSFILATIVPLIVCPIMNLTFIRIFLELNSVEERLRKLAITDELTGVYNRRYFLEIADREVERSIRFGKPFSIIMIDVDFFKRINDQNGHLAGDAVLKAIAEDCLRHCRIIDTFARFGGDEFIFLLPETSLEKALPFADRIRTAIAEMHINHLAASIAVTASLGVQTFAGAGETLERLLDRADRAMYDAKHSGKNRISTTTIADR